MANVATFHDQVGLEIVPATTFGTVPGGPTYQRVPLQGSTIAPVQDSGPLDDETGLGPQGTLSEYNYGRRFERGTIRVKSYYNLPVLWRMLASALGGCEVYAAGTQYANLAVTGTTDYSGTHLFMPQSYHAKTAGSVGARPPGFAGRLWLSGEDLNGHIAELDGMYINAVRFEQAQGEYAEWQFDYDTLKARSVTATGETLSSIPSALPLYPTVWSDLSANPNQSDFGTATVSSTATPIYSFSLSVSRSSSFQPASATNPTTLQKPRHLDPWQVSGEIVIPLESGLTPAARPNWPPFQANDIDHVGSITLRYSGPQIPGAVCVGQDVSYVLMILLPAVRWGTIEGGLQRGTPVYRIPFQAQAVASAFGFGGKTYRPLVGIYNQAIDVGDTGDGGGTFMPSASGGNDIPLGEIRVT